MDSGKIYRNSLNLWNENYDETIEVNQIVYIPIEVGNVSIVTCSTDCPKGTTSPPNPALEARLIFLLSGNVTTGAQNAINGISINAPRTVTPIDGFVTIAYRWVDTFEPIENWKPWNHHTMLNVGNIVIPYEPYNVVDWYTNTGHGYSSGAWD